MALLGHNELTHSGLVTPDDIIVSNGSSDGLLPDGTKDIT